MPTTVRPDWVSASADGARLSASFVRESYPCRARVSIAFDRPESAAREDFELAIISVSTNVVDISLVKGLAEVYQPRLLPAVVLTHFASTNGHTRDTLIRMSLGDRGLIPDALCFCATRDDAALIPDHAFVWTEGYAGAKTAYAAAEPWSNRVDRAYFRGTDSGVAFYPEHERRSRPPRIALAHLSRAFPDYLDAALTDVEAWRPDSTSTRLYYERNDLLRAREPQDFVTRYKYNIDVDGNSSSWSGLFHKLISGSPVLKVQSTFNNRQWYYDRLKPWVNYVPIKPDLSDLLTTIDTLRASPARAEQIGARGRELALSIEYQREMTRLSDWLAVRG